MNTAIVILNYNSAHLTGRYIQTLKEQNAYNHIIVVDNASKRQDREYLRKCCDLNCVVLIEARENRGYSAGNNIGIRYAIDKLHAEIIFVSNPDIICPKETIEAIKEMFSGREDVAVITGLVRNFDRNHTPQIYSTFAYKAPDYQDMLLNNFMVITKVRRKLFHHSIYENAEDVISKGELLTECVSGCYFAIRAAAYDAIHGFDEDIFLYFEESILGYKLKKAGYKELVINYPVYHDEDPEKNNSLKKNWRIHVFTQNSAKIYLTKYLGIGKLGVCFYQATSLFGFAEQSIWRWIKPLLNR